MKIEAMTLLCVFFTATPLLARQKTDVLAMNNGDRLTCEIRGLDAGILFSASITFKGTSVNWLKVRYIESKQIFLVHTESDAVYTGTLSTCRHRNFSSGTHRNSRSYRREGPLEQQQIVTINQTSERFWQRSMAGSTRG